MQRITNKIQAAEQGDRMNQLFLAGDYKRKKTLWENIESLEQQHPEIPLNVQESIKRNTRPEILDVMDVKDAKRSSKLFE